MHRTKVKVVEDALDANNTIARANRDDFDRAGVTVVNLMSAPGAGKTTLLERVAAGASTASASACSRATCRASLDADRLARLHVPVAQLNTDPASAASAISTRTWCARRSPALPLDEIDLLVIENVGNLVCPAEFRVGEDARVMVCSVTEGEDKPLKYPLMFRACELVLVNKIDLLAAPRLRPRQVPLQPRRVNPDVERMLVSARTGEGVDEWRAWLRAIAAREGRACVKAAVAGAAGGVWTRCSSGAPRRTRRSSRRRPSGWRGCATGWPSASPAAAGWSRSGARPAARSDARHVAVEFVHPVIVGKRALPALGLAGEGGTWPCRSGCWSRPDDIAIAFGIDEDDGDAARALAVARARGCLTIAFSRSEAEWGFDPPTGDPAVRQELVETLYHVLWELVHVFFDHRGLLDGRDAAPRARRRRVELPLPVPGRGRGRPRGRGRRRRAARC